LIKLILVMLLGWAGFTLVKKYLNPTLNGTEKTESGEKMVACSVCDTHIPESDAIIKDGKTFCSKEHSE
jgi:uncharacterized protein